MRKLSRTAAFILIVCLGCLSVGTGFAEVALPVTASRTSQEIIEEGDIETAFDIYYKTYDIHELPPLKE